MSAVISPCGLFRYRLERRVNPLFDGSLTFLMLNPSTADAEQDDPTIRRCMGFVTREQRRYLYVVNLFAYRTPDPADLQDAEDAGIGIEGPENDLAIAEEAARADIFVCAWGAHQKASERAGKVLEYLQASRIPLFCLGVTSSGAPRHPLFVRSAAPLIPYGRPA